MTERTANTRFRKKPWALLLILVAAFAISAAGWIYNVHRWLIEPTAVYNAAGPQENNYWAIAQFDIAVVRLENALLRFARQTPADATPVLIQYQIVLSKLALLSQPSEATATAFKIPAYRDTIKTLQQNFRDLSPFIDRLSTHLELTSEITDRVGRTEQVVSDLAQEIADAEVKHRDEQLRDFLKKRRAFYATTSAVCLTVMLTLITLITLLQQRRAAVVEKENAARAAHQAVKAKSAFLGVIGHELRTPLQTIISAIDTLAERPHSAKDMRIIMRLEQAAQQMITQMRDLADYSRLESGKLEIRCDTFDVAELLRNIVEDATPQAHGKGLRIRFETDLDSATAYTDSSRIRQIVANLVDNAIKYSDNGEIVVRLEHALEPNGRAEPDRFQINVEDQGVGIPLEKIGSVFEPFTQLDQSNTRRHDGIGMGLAIVHGLIGLLQGEIHVSSRVGKGSLFTVTFPSLRRPNGIQPDSIPVESDAQAAVSLNVLRVLVVDDQETMREAFARMLESLSIRFDMCSDACSALQSLANVEYDVLLLDIQMPEKDGYVMMRELRLMPGPNRHIPAIGISAYAHEMMDQTEIGIFSDYLMKPIRLASLRAAIERAVTPSHIS